MLGSSRVEERVHTAGVIHTVRQITITTHTIQNNSGNIKKLEQEILNKYKINSITLISNILSLSLTLIKSLFKAKLLLQSLANIFQQ